MRAEAISGAAITGMATISNADNFGRVDHQRCRPDEHEQIAQRRRSRGTEGGFDLRGVGGQTRDEFADARAVVKRGVEACQMGEYIPAQIRDHALAEGGDEIVARRRRQGDDHHGAATIRK